VTKLFLRQRFDLRLFASLLAVYGLIDWVGDFAQHGLWGWAVAQIGVATAFGFVGWSK
jgi:hypothetical protein